MRILHVINDFDYWFHHRKDLALQAIADGNEVSIAVNQSKNQEKISNLLSSVYNIPVYRFGIGLSDINLFFTLRRLINRKNFDCIHFFTIKPILIGGLAAISLPASQRPRVIATIAGLGRGFSFAGLKRAVLITALRTGIGKSAEMLVFENSEDAKVYVDMKIVNEIKTKVIKGAGIDLSLFYPKKNQEKTSVDYIFASRLLRSKGILDFVKAARVMKKQYGDAVRFRVAGYASAGEPDGLTDAELEMLQSEPSIEYLGKVPGYEMPALLRASDVFVLPTGYPEGLPRSILEAGACGLAVIAGDVAGTRVVIEDEKTGLLIENPTYDKIKQAMERFLLDPSLRKRCADGLEQKIAQGGFGLKEVNGTYMALYERLATLPRSKSEVA